MSNLSNEIAREADRFLSKASGYRSANLDKLYRRTHDAILKLRKAERALKALESAEDMMAKWGSEL